jgi:TolB-like protein/Flp pilus assembly protein TadD
VFTGIDFWHEVLDPRTSSGILSPDTGWRPATGGSRRRHPRKNRKACAERRKPERTERLPARSDPAASPPSPDAVRRELAGILSSEAFKRAERMGHLLEYLVGQTLAGRADPLKEYAIGTEVLGRPETFDPRTDSVVRVEAHRLRARLAAFYAVEGADDEVVIELPRGGYTPTFRSRPRPAATPGSPVVDVALTVGQVRWRPAVFAGLAVLVAGVATAVALAVWAMQPGSDAAAATIAVLHFTVASEDDQDRLLSDGFVDELTTALAKVKGLRVIARSSSGQFKDATDDFAGLARRLNAGAVVRGSFRRVGPRLRISVQLIRVPDAYHLWADTYEPGEGDLASVEEDISRRIAAALGVSGTPRAGAGERRPLPAAYDLYLKGRSFRSLATPEGLLQAGALFEASAAADPSYALAFAGVAEVHATLAFHGIEPPTEAIAKAKAASERSLSLDPDAAEAHAAAALIRFAYDWDWPAAERAFRRAVELNPSAVRTRVWYAIALSTRRRSDDALAQLAVVRQLDPLSVGAGNDLATILFYARRYDEAMAQARRTLQANPRLSVAHVLLGECLAAAGEYEAAIEEYRKAVDPSARISLVLGRLGRAMALAGRRDEARALAAQIEAAPVRSGTPNTELAFIYAGLGEHDRAFAALDRALTAREGEMLFLGVAPAFDGLRVDPRFDALLRRVGLTGN